LQAILVRDSRSPRSGDAEETAQVDGMITRGESVNIGIRVTNNADRPVLLNAIRIRTHSGGAWTPILGEQVAGFTGTVIPPHKSHQLAHRITISADAPYSQPYWFRKSRSDNRYELIDPAAEGEPFSDPPFLVSASISPVGADKAAAVSWEMPVQYRWFDPASAKERRMALQVVPALSVSMNPDLLVVPIGKTVSERTLLVNVHDNVPGPAAAAVVLKLPQGWSCQPESVTLNFSRENEQASARFSIRIPPMSAPADHRIRAEVRLGNEAFDSGYQTIAYHHIQTRHLYHPAETLVRSFEVKVPAALKIGYVMGVGDEVPDALEQLGATVQLLDADDLAYGDLTGFDAIVTGIRAYKDRTDLMAGNARLLDYVKNGGNLVVQYNKYEFDRAAYGPWPASIDRPHDRVTDENSAVRILLPDHPVFKFPNRIADEDWKGWIQERGLYFLGQWDRRYQALLELQDPFPYNNEPKQGALIAAQYGKGTWFYTGLGFFRQLPEGVPGAYRLFANLVSQKRAAQKPAPGRK
jgi:hypothetical protein